MTILYADDDAEDRELFADALKEILPTTKLILAGHGKEVIQKLSALSKSPDYIFLDINMPIMDGYDCLVKLKELSHTKHIPVIMYTTSSNAMELKKYMALGASAFVIKEPSFQGIKNSLTKALIK